MTNGNIILCGFMGCGKTTVGKQLARLYGYTFVDLDSQIESRGLVVASGGGTVLRAENVEAFHRGGGVVVYLDAPLAALQERLKRDKRRPLLQVPDRRRVIAQLHAQRGPLYQGAADLTVDAGAPPLAVAKRVAAACRTWKAAGSEQEKAKA